MPCTDVTERIELQLDHADRLTSYSLEKLTCGADIGERALLSELVVGRGVNEILDLHGDDVSGHFAPRESREFLYFKHLVALQEAIRVVCGDASGEAGQPCVAASIGADPTGVRFVGQIAVELMTERIRACGGCGSCAEKSAKQAI